MIAKGLSRIYKFEFMVTRRNFVKSASLALPIITTHTLFVTKIEAKCSNKTGGPTIKKITIFKSTGSFYRFVGMNSYDKAPKGINGTRSHFTIELSDGTIGLGTCGYSAIDEEVIDGIRKFVGMDPVSFYQWESEKIIGIALHMQAYFYSAKYAWLESGILDVIGKLKNLPVWKLIGESVRDSVDPYDGTMYFEDIANNTDVSIIGKIGKRIKEDGYRAIKIKLGRPSKWLLGEAGVNRDIEAFIALREAVGQNFNIMADANNGYANQFDWALKLMKSCAPYNMYFMEELFPDDALNYMKLREELLKENIFIPIAEGENIREVEKFEEYCLAGVYSYIQPDMPTCGFSNIVRAAKNAEKYPHVKLIPHVWQSQFGLIMSLHASKIQWNIPFVEDSRYFEHAFMTNGYLFSDGKWTIPDKPGWGIELSPNFSQFVVEKEIIIV